MAERPIFSPDHVSLVDESLVEFEWFPGFAAVQKARSIEALHKAGSQTLGKEPFLEVSSKSPYELGVKLSAFNLCIPCSFSEKPLLLEAAFQGSKVFEKRGKQENLYSFDSGRDIKRFMKEQPEDNLVGFNFENRDWDLTPQTAFYDWLYLQGLRKLEAEEPSFLNDLFGYEGFTDIEFNPQRSINCQARSCALYVSLSSQGILSDVMTDPDSFIETLKERDYGVPPEQGSLFTD